MNAAFGYSGTSELEGRGRAEILLQILAVKVTLFQSERAAYAHDQPQIFDLPTALLPISVDYHTVVNLQKKSYDERFKLLS